MAPVSTKEATSVGLRKAQLGIVINILLAATKGVAGVVGHSYALVADAIESASDIILKTAVKEDQNGVAGKKHNGF